MTVKIHSYVKPVVHQPPTQTHTLPNHLSRPVSHHLYVHHEKIAFRKKHFRIAKIHFAIYVVIVIIIVAVCLVLL